MVRHPLTALCISALLAAGCSSPSSDPAPPAVAAPAVPALGIRPNGSHAANEYFVIEGAGRVYGMAGAEKSVATVLYNFAGLNNAAAHTN